ncbi:hypothetical protein HOY34_09915 [Xinfangfangia sp. D13-10-4-6]|uniref:hypothetical protein n=1 Tax=Pseudogemmobacter hezensis TaxID=2737662 RepID=UPI001553B94E|nr:hypothetical protein [Pseudogemmobacter hezensis]NPD15515.1 hypothetical protein [Pseudogemmobacter hezensis]
MIDEATITIKLAHVRLCHSRLFFVRACLPFARSGGQLGRRENSLPSCFLIPPNLVCKICEQISVIVTATLAFDEGSC